MQTLLSDRQMIIPSWGGIPTSISIHPSFNDDVRLSTFIGAGQQRKGIQYNITDARSMVDHVERATQETFHLAGDILFRRNYTGRWNSPRQRRMINSVHSGTPNSMPYRLL